MGATPQRSRLPFAKYEGLGNDFVLVRGDALGLDALTPARVRALCDRHTGVGADGVLWVGAHEPGTHAAGARMVLFNADGSRPEMCGNGVRCVAALCADEAALAVGATVLVQSDAGPRPATLLGYDAAAQAWQVEVAMGPVRVSYDPLRVARDVDAVPVDAGNPHAVVFSSVSPGGEDELVRAITLRREAWPRGTNVELVRDDGPGCFAVRVHERGVGWTRACGTGAVAVAAAAVGHERNGARVNSPVRVALEGGALEVVLAPTAEHDLFVATMRGPARRVFVGEASVL